MRGNSKNKGGRGGHMKVGAWWGPERKARVTMTLNNSEHFHLKYWFLKFMIKIKNYERMGNTILLFMYFKNRVIALYLS